MADSTLSGLSTSYVGASGTGTELAYLDDGTNDAKATTAELKIFNNIVASQSKSADYTLVLGDANKFLLHPVADTNNRTFTLPANASVAYPVGTWITFVNEVNTLSIAITSDTMTLAGGTSTGTRSLAAFGVATALKTASTRWVISGTNLT